MTLTRNMEDLQTSKVSCESCEGKFGAIDKVDVKEEECLPTTRTKLVEACIGRSYQKFTVLTNLSIRIQFCNSASDDIPGQMADALTEFNDRQQSTISDSKSPSLKNLN